MKSILEQSQLERDKELAVLINKPLDYIFSLPIAKPDSIRIFNEKEKVPENLESLYSNYKYMNFDAYLRTLMFTSIKRRHPELFILLKTTRNKKCLDFGSGVGTHAIALLENDNDITILDVPSKLFDFAIKRIQNRGYSFESLSNRDNLPNNYYDVIICTNVLEHCQNPMNELKRITKSLKSNGIIHLQVSNMIKISSGHFAESIIQWKKFGNNYLNKYYKKLGETLWQKI